LNQLLAADAPQNSVCLAKPSSDPPTLTPSALLSNKEKIRQDYFSSELLLLSEEALIATK